MTFKRRVISSALIKSPLPAPGHFSQVFFHLSGVKDVLSQERPSPALTGANRVDGCNLFTIIKDANRRWLFLSNSFGHRPAECELLWSHRCFRLGTSQWQKISSSFTQTKPGAPVQQLPHRVHRNCKPSW